MSGRAGDGILRDFEQSDGRRSILGPVRIILIVITIGILITYCDYSYYYSEVAAVVVVVVVVVVGGGGGVESVIGRNSKKRRLLMPT